MAYTNEIIKGQDTVFLIKFEELEENITNLFGYVSNITEELDYGVDISLGDNNTIIVKFPKNLQDLGKYDLHLSFTVPNENTANKKIKRNVGIELCTVKAPTYGDIIEKDKEYPIKLSVSKNKLPKIIQEDYNLEYDFIEVLDQNDNILIKIYTGDPDFIASTCGRQSNELTKEIDKLYGSLQPGINQSETKVETCPHDKFRYEVAKGNNMSTSTMVPGHSCKGSKQSSNTTNTGLKHNGNVLTITIHKEDIKNLILEDSNGNYEYQPGCSHELIKIIHKLAHKVADIEEKQPDLSGFKRTIFEHFNTQLELIHKDFESHYISKDAIHGGDFLPKLSKSTNEDWNYSFRSGSYQVINGQLSFNFIMMCNKLGTSGTDCYNTRQDTKHLGKKCKKGAKIEIQIPDELVTSEICVAEDINLFPIYISEKSFNPNWKSTINSGNFFGRLIEGNNKIQVMYESAITGLKECYWGEEILENDLMIFGSL